MDIQYRGNTSIISLHSPLKVTGQYEYINVKIF
jgi:hypothetical protein